MDNMNNSCAYWREKLATLSPENLLPGECEALDIHLASCPACKMTLTEYKEMDKRIRFSLLPDGPLPVSLLPDEPLPIQNKLHVFQQPDRATCVQLIFVAVDNHQGDPLLLSPATIPNTVFLVGDVGKIILTTNHVLPDLLLLDTRLSEGIKCALTYHLGMLYNRQLHKTPLIANVHMEVWQEANRDSEQMKSPQASKHQLEYLLAIAVSKLTIST